jgi:FkbM family methyltransferase
MNKQIHIFLKKLGYKVSNISTREKEIQELVNNFAVQNDISNLVFNSAPYLLEIRKYFPDIELKKHKEGVIAFFNGLAIYVESPEEFFIIKEVFIEKDYNLFSNEKLIIFDIGMNVGISTLFFALNKNVTKIYSFEPVVPTHNQAIYNLELNPSLSNKIQTFNYGLGSLTRTEKVLYNSQAKGNCGIRLDLSLVINKDNAQEIDIDIKNIGDVIPNLLAKHPDQKKVLKIDCEGAEYEILEKLDELNLLADIDILLIEWHDKGAKVLEKILIDNNFRVISRHLTSISGMIYAFKGTNLAKITHANT